MPSPRLPPLPLPAPRERATAQEPPPEVADAWIHRAAEHSPGTHEAPAGHPTGTRQAPGAAALVQRRGGALRRLNTYLRPETFEALAAYCAREREDMARVVDRAVAEYLRDRGQGG